MTGYQISANAVPALALPIEHSKRQAAPHIQSCLALVEEVVATQDLAGPSRTSGHVAFQLKTGCEHLLTPGSVKNHPKQQLSCSFQALFC